MITSTLGTGSACDTDQTTYDFGGFLLRSPGLVGSVGAYEVVESSASATTGGVPIFDDSSGPSRSEPRRACLRAAVAGPVARRVPGTWRNARRWCLRVRPASTLKSRSLTVHRLDRLVRQRRACRLPRSVLSSTATAERPNRMRTAAPHFHRFRGSRAARPRCVRSEHPHPEPDRHVNLVGYAGRVRNSEPVPDGGRRRGQCRGGRGDLIRALGVRHRRLDPRFCRLSDGWCRRRRRDRRGARRGSRCDADRRRGRQPVPSGDVVRRSAGSRSSRRARSGRPARTR